MQITITRDIEGLQEALVALAREGKRVALVPTMGALHEGHASLIRRARELADAVVVSVFVNPKQFSSGEDLDKYPRMLEDDIKKIDEAGGSIVYAPAAEDLYPQGYSTTVSAGALGDILCGKFRPGHFDGVATIVAKLLLRVLPHVALFGEKDYQQLCVIRRIVSDLDIPVEIVSAPTIRETDGLAMSSRNSYLTAAERTIAPTLYQLLSTIGNELAAGTLQGKPLLDQGVAALSKAGFKVDYLELRHAETLEPADNIKQPARLLAAAWLGKTRLIDNIALEAA